MHAVTTQTTTKANERVILVDGSFAGYLEKVFRRWNSAETRGAWAWTGRFRFEGVMLQIDACDSVADARAKALRVIEKHLRTAQPVAA